jgi:type I restriction enzyme S subunit
VSRLVSLRDVCERIDYGLTTSAVLDGDGPRLLRITDIDNSFIDWESVPRCEASIAEATKYALQTGDIVIARTGASTGRSQWVQLTEPSVFASYLVRFRTKADYDSRFIGYVLHSKRWSDHVASVAHGKSAQPNMSAAEMARFDFKCPDLPTQQAIAEVLGALDDKIAANTKLASVAAHLADVIYDTTVAAHTAQPMSQVLNPILGGTPPRASPDYWEGNHLWASAKDVTSAPFGMIVDTAEKISETAATATKAKPLPVGSVILTARGTVGAVARLAVPSSFNQSCYGFVPGTIPPGILYFSILRATQRAKAIAHGSVFDTITMKTFDHLEVPSLDGTALEALESRIGPLLDVISDTVKENVTLAANRGTLLPQLMSGKLRVKDAEVVVGNFV